MRASAIGFVIALALVPAAAFAQAGPPGGPGGPPPGEPGAPPPGGQGGPPSGQSSGPPHGAISREQYIQRAEQRAGRMAGQRFDQIDVNHTGYVTPAEIRAWAAQRRGAPAGPGGPPPQQQ